MSRNLVNFHYVAIPKFDVYQPKLFDFDSLKCLHITHFNTQCPPSLIFIYQIYFLIHPSAHSSITDLTTFCFYRNVTKKKKDVIYGSLNFLITLFFFAALNSKRIPNSLYQFLQLFLLNSETRYNEIWNSLSDPVNSLLWSP